MDGLSRMAGGCGSYLLAGRTRRVGPLRLRHWAEVEQHLLFRRPSNPLPEVRRVTERTTDARLANSLVRMAEADLRADKLRRVVKLDEVLDWINRAEGVAYTGWCCLRDLDPDFRHLEAVEAALADLDREGILEFVRLRDQLSGTDLLASADWPDPEAGVRPERLERRRKQLAKQFIPWRRFYYVTGSNFGFTPEAINDLTLYQAKVYMSKPEDIGVGGGEGGHGGSVGTFQAARRGG